MPAPLASSQLELARLYSQGELHKLVAVARQTELTLDVVRGPSGR